MDSVDLTTLLKDIPKGAWVAISDDNQSVVTFGADMRVVLEDAKKKGVQKPLIVRNPLELASLILYGNAVWSKGLLDSIIIYLYPVQPSSDWAVPEWFNCLPTAVDCRSNNR